MRCLSCNCNLSDFESTRKSEVTRQYIDLCNKCFLLAEIDTGDERYDLEGKDEHYVEPNHGEV